MLKLSEEAQKNKSKLLLVSSVSLFVGITQSLPTKVAIIGLDLSSNPKVLGWFILLISLYFFLKFLASTILDIIEYHLPELINKKAQNTTGEILGLTAHECYEAQYERYEQYATEDIGTPQGELSDIRLKNQAINLGYNKSFIKLRNVTTYTVDIVMPFALWVAGTIYLYRYLNVIK
jgi:hypothetical protein